MPFIRHELGKRLRIKRIPDLHVHLDDTAERGTRILQLLAEIEAGATPDADVPAGRVAADAGRARPSDRRPRRGAAVRGPSRSSRRVRGSGGPGPGRRPRARTVSAANGSPMTVDLAPYLDAVPQAVVDRLEAARACSRSATRTRTPTRSAPRSASSASSRRWVVAPTPSARIPVPPLYDFIDGVERFRTDPDEAAAYDLLVISDCGSLERIGEVAARHADLFERLPRVIIDHHASNDAAGEAPTGSTRHAAATCEMVTLLAARLGFGLDAGRRRAGGRADGRHRHGHRDLRPPERDARGRWSSRPPWSRPGRRCRTSRGGSIGPSRRPSCGCSASSSTGSRASDDGRIVWSSITDADIAATGADRAHSEGIIDLLSQAEAAEVAIVFKQSGEATRVSVRTKPGGVDATVLTGSVRGRWPRASGRRVDRGAARGRPAARPRGGDPARRRARSLSVARSSLGPGLDGIIVVAKPAGPTSHDIVALVRRSGRDEARRPRRDARSVRVRRAAGLPGPRHARRRVPPRRSQGLPRHGLLRGVVDDRRPRRRADPRTRRHALRPRETIEAALPGLTGTISQRPPAYSAIKVGGRRAYAMARAGETVELADARGDDPRARPRVVGRLRPGPPDRGHRRRVLGGHVHPGAGARPRRARSGAPPISGR